jgi:hypothetical protein
VVVVVMLVLMHVLAMPKLVLVMPMPMLVFFKKMRQGVDEDVTEDTARGKSQHYVAIIDSARFRFS